MTQVIVLVVVLVFVMLVVVWVVGITMVSAVMLGNHCYTCDSAVGMVTVGAVVVVGW